MNISIDLSYMSRHKNNEELCGDIVEIISTDAFKLMVLADGMGSGVRANILATMTSKILTTMIKEGLSIDEAIETVAKTLPVSSVNGVAYSTFSLIQIFYTGEVYIAEYDNPLCVCLREHKLYDLPFRERSIYGKLVRECRIHAQIGDAFLFMSDGAIYCSGDDVMNLKWDRDAVAEYAQKSEPRTRSAKRLAMMVNDVCNDLYLGVPKDDTTIAVAKFHEERVVSILTGPPKDISLDAQIVRDFMEPDGIKIVSGGTSSELVARELGRKVETDFSSMGDIPPMSVIEGIDCVTEGVITLQHVLEMLNTYANEELDMEYFLNLEKHNGASEITNLLIDDCTKVCFFVGTAEKIQDSKQSVSFDLSVRKNIVEKMSDLLKQLDKDVQIKYY